MPRKNLSGVLRIRGPFYYRLPQVPNLANDPHQRSDDQRISESDLRHKAVSACDSSNGKGGVSVSLAAHLYGRDIVQQ